MEAKIVDKKTYELVTKNIKNVFNKSSFIELNCGKVEDILYIIVYKEDSPRFGVAFGKEEGDILSCPFSAPFGYIEPLKKEQTVEHYMDALVAIENLIQKNGYKKVTFIFPPDFYDKNVINCWYNIMLNRDWEIEFVDLSFSIHISNMIKDYEKKISYNARKNLRISLKSNLEFKECRSEEEKIEAYRVIKVNRESKGYPLRMTQEQVLSTIKIVPSNMYLVSCEKENLAAALVYDVTDTIAQVVYWGDIPGCSSKKVINYLAYELIHIYYERGFEYLDIGPSTEYGRPNYGLCDFKDSIGCERTAKFRLYKQFIE